ncbi:Aspartyl protease [Trichlorobacter thiogenes]|uniref:Aspartyl protease n=1 Tax=Trichlorobacter thiogenes TaxID=115783 RepID=A0A1T4SAE1_9BACT|nr:retropepsin-like aspartic protease [Trichlorobacter thiogenes]SKA25066.1 Aspartyl protease [Trichlorobacter thiogenes]
MEFKAGKGPSRPPKITEGSSDTGYILITVVVMVVTGIMYVLFSKEGYTPVRWVFGDTSRVSDPYFIPMAKPDTNQPPPPNQEPIEQDQPRQIMEHIPQQQASAGDYYQYKDKNGNIAFTDNSASIPRGAEAKNWNGTSTGGKFEVLKGQGRETQIIAERDRVYVPVKIRSAGVERELLLILDTGATGVMIYQDAVQGIRLNNIRSGYATLANGSQVQQLAGTVDSVSVGTAVARDFEIRIMQQVGQKDHQGLLGMSFLKNFHYTLDMNRKVIRWN